MCVEVEEIQTIKSEVTESRVRLLNSVNNAERELRLFIKWIKQKQDGSDYIGQNTKSAS